MDEMRTQLNNLDSIQPLNEIKVVFLGDGGVGKSHLIARLLKGDLSFTELDYTTTPGIAINDWTYVQDGRTVNVHLWDFGGQEILHTMHNLFLTKRTLYVVVVNARDETQDDRARYWLHKIKVFTEDAPVILVLNKIDQNPKATVNEPGLRTFYPGLREIVSVSALEFSQKKFTDTFVVALKRQIAALGTTRMQVSSAWRRLKDMLHSMPQSYIRGQEYMEYCEICGVQDSIDTRKALLEWFSDLGISFHYSESSDLEDYWICRPEWITNVLYILLYNEIQGNQNGVITHRDIHYVLKRNDLSRDSIQRILPGVFYSANEVQFVLNMLRKFGLSCQIDHDTEFIPMLCDRDAKPVEQAYQGPDSLEFHMEFDYLPNSVLHRLMVDRKNELDLDNVWRTGARFVQKETGLSAVVTIDDNRLKFFVRSKDAMHRPNTYLAVLKENLDRIWKEMGLQAPESLVIYKEGGVAEPFSYETLLAMMESGQQTVFSVRRRRMISISDILNQFSPETKQYIDKLLNDIAQACTRIQMDGVLLRTEDSRNRILKNELWSKGYTVADQSLAGSDLSAKYAGEPDLLIMDGNRQPLTVIEALNVSGGGASIRNWDRHLYQLLNNYNPSGLKSVFLISYVQCAKEHYPSWWDRYREHMRWHSPDRSRLREGSYEEIQSLQNQNPFLRVAKCDYDFGGMTATVYHYFVWIMASSEKEPAPEKPKHNVPSPAPSPILTPPFAPVPAPELPPAPAPELPPAPASDLALTEHEQEPDTSVSVQAETEESALMEYRIVLLGDSEAGKSLILARVKDPEMDPASFSGDTTPGIDIYSSYETIEDQRVRVNYWDFGGQEILHSMHRMFLSDQTLYVIILNTRNDNQDAQADFWLRYVETYAPGAPVLLVMNKIDQNPRAALNLPVLRRRINRDFIASDVLAISAVEKDPEVFRNAFTEKLFLRIAQCLRKTNGFSSEEARIRDKVREKKKTCQVIRQDDFLDICEDEGLKELEKQEILMNRFHEMGIMVFFGEGKPMLLNPEWITQAIYKVLEKREDIAQNGVVPHKKLRDLFRRELGKAYGSDDAAFVLEVMQAYGLSFPYERRVAGVAQTEDKEFIPMLCQREEPEQIEDLVLADDTLELQLFFEYLPGGVLYQLLVDNHKKLDKDLVWLTGAKFGSGSENYSIVRRVGNVMSIYVHNVDKATSVEQLREIAKQIEIIAEHTKYRAKIIEKKIGFVVADEKEYFDYDRLLNARSCDLHYVASRIQKKRICVSDILDQGVHAKERERDEMLRLIMAGCKDLQKDSTFWNVDENARNRQIGRTLRQHFIVSDQPQAGKSGTGDSLGELDIEIRTDKDTPFAILEALNTTSVNTAKWRSHLDKLLDNYNTSGLPYLILVTYVKGPKTRFGQKCGDSEEFWQKVEPSGFQGCLGKFDPVSLDDDVELICVTRADYVRNNFTVSLYHFVVHIGDDK